MFWCTQCVCADWTTTVMLLVKVVISLCAVKYHIDYTDCVEVTLEASCVHLFLHVLTAEEYAVIASSDLVG